MLLWRDRKRAIRKHLEVADELQGTYDVEDDINAAVSVEHERESSKKAVATLL